jgi:glycosyltransferase A (GT-A) superfamily protein (DUF2064 family)
VTRKALLVFADPTGLDLARRRFPKMFRSLFEIRSIGAAQLDADVHLFTSAYSPGTPDIEVHRQVGSTFAERLEGAIEKVASVGYDEIVMVGRDCPHLEVDDIATAFASLEEKQLVLGPDHQGGCYLIGFRSRDRHLLRGIQWKRNTDCEQLQHRCADRQVFLLPIKQDLDSWFDLRILALASDGFGKLIRFFFILICSLSERRSALFVDAARRKMRTRWQLPPPAFVA